MSRHRLARPAPHRWLYAETLQKSCSGWVLLRRFIVLSKKKTDTERAYWRLRQAILHVEHEPNEKLQLDELKNRYGMGASPLREALARLSSEGLVVFSGGRGFRAAGISAADLRDIALVREML